MGNVLSASSVYANAYLTKKGRDYLFNQGNTRFLVNPTTGDLIDLMKITHFTLSDPDVNYNLTDGIRLESGDVPDISGNNESCIKSTAIMGEKNLISYDGELITSNTGNGDIAIDYETDFSNDTMLININVSNQPDSLLGTVSQVSTG